MDVFVSNIRNRNLARSWDLAQARCFQKRNAGTGKNPILPTFFQSLIVPFELAGPHFCG